MNESESQDARPAEPAAAEPNAPAAAEAVPWGANSPRGYIFDLLDNLSNASFTHFQHVRNYEAQIRRKLIIYIALFAHPAGIIGLEDSETIENVLRSCDLTPFQGLDLMIHSPGGLPDAAGDIIRVCRAYAPRRDDAPSFRVIVPNMAMSAATVLAMGSDSIVMSDTSKLGPIDPQMVFQTKEGTFIRAAKSFLDAFSSLVNEANQLAAAQQPLAAHLHLLTKQDPSWIVECMRARNATQDLSFRVLKNGMLQHTPDDQIRAVVQRFFDVGDTTSHSRTISAADAQQMGLVIDRVDRNSDFWNLVWDLYVRSERYTREKGLAKYICADTGAIEVRARVLGGR